MNKYGIIFLVSAELIVIFVMGLKIFQKNKNVLGTMSVYPIKKESLIFHPTDKLKYFYEPVPNSLEYSPDFLPNKTIYNINGDSLNAIINFPIEKPLDTFRIITLGDSFTFGVGVNTKDNWPEKLEDMLKNSLKCKKIEVINLGVPGYDIEYSVERFKIRGSKYKPDLVIWFLKKDDFTQIGEIFRPELNQIEKKLTQLQLNQLVWRKKNIVFNDWLNVINNYTINKMGEERVLKKQLKNLEKINNFYNGPLLIFTFPLTEDKYQSIMKKFSNKRKNTLFYDGITRIYNNKNLYLPDGHPSKEGHERIATDLFNYLIKNKIIPCN